MVLSRGNCGAISNALYIVGKLVKKRKKLSEVGFEPTPSFEDQNLSLAP